LFIGTWASTNAPQSNAQDQAQKQGPTINAPPTPTPTPGAPPPGIAHVFEIEGNVCNDSAEGTDWNEVNPPTDPACDPGFVTGDPDGAGPVQLATFVIDTCPDDRVFTIGSSKDFNDIQGNWHSTIGSVPDKDEITHAYAAISIVPTTAGSTADGTAGHRILTFGGDRFATNGDANIGLWFFQNEVSVDPVSGDFQGTHLNGDLFVVSAFTGGGGTSVIDVYEWVGSPLSGAAALCSGLGGALDNAGTLCKLPATQNKGFAIVNPADLSGACPGGGGFDWPYTTKGDRTPCLAGPCDAPKGSFYEGGLDLSDLGFANTCFSTFLLETRSSQTVDAILKDFAIGSFDTCALEVTKSPETQSLCEGGTATYKYSVHNAGVSPLFVTVVDDSGTPGDTTDDYDAVSGVLVSADAGGIPVELSLTGGQTAGSCSDTIPTNPCLTDRSKQFLTVPDPNPEINIVTASGRLISGGTIVKTDTAQASTTVNPTPTCSISGLTPVCVGATNSYSSSVSPTGGTVTHSWSISGDGTINGSNTGSSVSVTATSGVTGSFTLTDSIVRDGCPSSCQYTVTVNPLPTCSIVGPDDLCGGATGTYTSTVDPAGGTVTHSWSITGDGTFAQGTDTSASSVDVVAGASGSFTVFDSVTRDGCAALVACEKTTTVNPNPTVVIAGDEACSTDEVLVLTATVSPSGGTITDIVWTGPGVDANTPGQGTLSLDAALPGTYTVTLKRNGCSGGAHLHVGLCGGTSVPD